MGYAPVDNVPVEEMVTVPLALPIREPGVAQPVTAVDPTAVTTSPSDAEHSNVHEVESPQQVAQEPSENTNEQFTKSQEVWNDAFNSLAQYDDTKTLVERYTNTLNINLGNGAANDATPEQSKSAAARQAEMALLVKNDQKKIKRSSKITRKIGSFIESILLAKPLGDFLIENIPQAAPAAIPWAATCGALQVCNLLLTSTELFL